MLFKPSDIFLPYLYYIYTNGDGDGGVILNIPMYCIKPSDKPEDKIKIYWEKKSKNYVIGKMKLVGTIVKNLSYDIKPMDNSQITINVTIIGSNLPLLLNEGNKEIYKNFVSEHYNNL